MRVFRLSGFISCGGEEVGALAWSDGVDEASDGGPQAFDGALGGLSQQRLELGESHLDRESKAGRREGVPHRLDGSPHGRPLVAAEVVHDDGVAGAEFGHQHPIDLGLEGVAVDRPVEDEGRGDAEQAQAGDEGGGLSVAVRHGGAQSLAPGAASAQAGHIGGRPGLAVSRSPSVRR